MDSGSEARLIEDAKKRGWKWGKKYWLPVETKSNKDEARSLSKKLREDGYDTEIEEVKADWDKEGSKNSDYWKGKGGTWVVWRSELREKFPDRPVYGNPIDFRGLRHEPVNENGVILLFGMIARDLGYSVEAVQAGFPDCEAKKKMPSGQWQQVRIEFEYESKNFSDHGHSTGGCDVIVCWRHNWADCPSNIYVEELSKVIGQLAKSGV